MYNTMLKLIINFNPSNTNLYPMNKYYFLSNEFSNLKQQLLDKLHGQHQYGISYHKLNGCDCSGVQFVYPSDTIWTANEIGLSHNNTAIWKNGILVSKKHPRGLNNLFVNKNGIFLLYVEANHEVKLIKLNFNYKFVSVNTYNTEESSGCCKFQFARCYDEYILLAFNRFESRFIIIDTNMLECKAFDGHQPDIVAFDKFNIYYTLIDVHQQYKLSTQPTLIYKTGSSQQTIVFPDTLINMFCYQNQLYGYSKNGLYVWKEEWFKINSINYNFYDCVLYPSDEYVVGRIYIDGNCYLKIKMSTDNVITDNQFINVYGHDGVQSISCPVSLLMGSEMYDIISSDRWAKSKITFPFDNKIVEQWIVNNPNPSIVKLTSDLLCQNFICHNDEVINNTKDKILLKMCMDINDFIQVLDMGNSVVELLIDQLAVSMFIHKDKMTLNDYEKLCLCPQIIMNNQQKSDNVLHCLNKYEMKLIFDVMYIIDI